MRKTINKSRSFLVWCLSRVFLRSPLDSRSHLGFRRFPPLRNLQVLSPFKVSKNLQDSTHLRNHLGSKNHKGLIRLRNHLVLNLPTKIKPSGLIHTTLRIRTPLVLRRDSIHSRNNHPWALRGSRSRVHSMASVSQHSKEPNILSLSNLQVLGHSMKRHHLSITSILEVIQCRTQTSRVGSARNSTLALTILRRMFSQRQMVGEPSLRRRLHGSKRPRTKMMRCNNRNSYQSKKSPQNLVKVPAAIKI